MVEAELTHEVKKELKRQWKKEIKDYYFILTSF